MIARDLLAAMTPVVEALEDLRVTFLIGGSVASSVYGIARATLDADLMADLRSQHVRPLVERLQATYYIDEGAVRDAVRNRASFNVIHLPTMIKVDVFVSKAQPFDRAELRRIRLDTLEDTENARTFPVASPEDMVLRKLEWYRVGGEVSDRQWTDVLGILKVQATALDMVYLRQWAGRLGLSDLLGRAVEEAGL
jgi:hypothetical protein